MRWAARTGDAVLQVKPGAKNKPIKDAKGNVVGQRITGDFSKHEVH